MSNGRVNDFKFDIRFKKFDNHKISLLVQLARLNFYGFNGINKRLVDFRSIFGLKGIF